MSKHPKSKNLSLTDSDSILSLLIKNMGDHTDLCDREKLHIEAAIGRLYINYRDFLSSVLGNSIMLIYQKNDNNSFIDTNITLDRKLRTVFIRVLSKTNGHSRLNCTQIDIPGEILGVAPTNSENRYNGWFFSLERGERDANLHDLIRLMSKAIVANEHDIEFLPDLSEEQDAGNQPGVM